jgi:2-polyprenyl-6-methoxyphenol hydroxylase-like FAD-dependent oxidoreductase
VIIGAGPTGLLLAGDLAQAGVPVVVLDPLVERGLRAPGVAVNSASAELLDERGLLDEIRDDGIMLPQVHFSLLWLDPSHQREPHADAFLIPQSRVEELLAQRAVDLGADLRLGHRLESYEPGADEVTALVAGRHGRYPLPARYLVGCDGAVSSVRTAAGIEFPGTVDPGCDGIVADVEVPFDQLEPALFGTVLSGAGSVYNGAPYGPGGLRVMTVEFGRDDVGIGEPGEAELRAAVTRITGQRLAGRVVRTARYTNAVHHAERLRAGPVFLAGDAAHLLFAFGGLGLSTGLHDAANLGWKLAAAHQGWAAPGLLDTYQAERLPVIERVCRSVRAQASLLSPPSRVNPLRDLLTELIALPAVEQFLLDQVTGTAAAYPHPADAHPLVGRRLPDVTLATADGVGRVAELLRAGRGVLLAPPDGPEAELAAPWKDRLDLIGTRLAEATSAKAALLRPDGYVAWATDDRDDASLRAALATWFGAPEVTER